METDDLVARLQKMADKIGLHLSDPPKVPQDAALMLEAAARISALEAQLAARDAEIAAWLRGQSSTGLFFATAIESGAYRKDAQ